MDAAAALFGARLGRDVGVTMNDSFELIVIGGGPAGLSAALVAARARRKVLLVDGCEPRNAVAPAVHTFVTRDGVLPAEFRQIARAQLQAYPTVTIAEGEVTAIAGASPEFRVTLAGGRSAGARVVLLATGLVDILPDVPGLRERWGRGVHHCPYCDGFEHRDERWGVLADEPTVFDYALFLRGWTPLVTLFTMGAEPQGDMAGKLERAGIVIETAAVTGIVASAPHRLDAVELAGGRRVPIESLWLRPAQRQRGLAAGLGLEVDDDGGVRHDGHGETPTPGIFVAGDVAAGAVQQAVQAAADGARVAMAINHRLIVDDGRLAGG